MLEMTNLHWNEKVFMLTILSSLEMLKAVKLTAFNISNEDEINPMSKTNRHDKLLQIALWMGKEVFLGVESEIYVLLLLSPNYIYI